MSLIKSMTLLIKLSRMFGVFPYKVTHVGDFCSLEISKPRLRYTIVLFLVLSILDGYSAFSYALIYSFDELASRLIITLSSLALYVDFILVFRTVVKKRDILCFWLNKIDDLFVSISSANDLLHRMTSFNRHLVLFSFSYLFILAATEILHEPVPILSSAMDVVYLLRFFVIHLFLAQFTVLVNSVRVFYKMNHLNVSKRRKSKVPLVFWVKNLQKLKKMDLLIKDFIENLHSIYVPVLSIAFMWGFFSLLCAIVLGNRAGLQPMMVVEWIICILFEVSLPTILCHLASREANKMVSFLQETFIDLDNPELLFEVETFSLQLQHKKLEFTVFESFKLDCTLLYSMAGATWTYSIIVLQFQEEHMTQIYVNSTNASSVFV